MTASTSVFITGATGFIATHIVVQLLQKGYKVVGTVRSSDKGEELKKNLKSHNFQYEIVPDIVPENAFDEALSRHPEVTVILHTASPFHFKTTDPENDLIIPAINGTLNALNSIHKNAPQVKKVVITSSYAAVCASHMEIDPNCLITEQSWNDITREEAQKDPVSGYRGSKTFAEKAAWEFMESKNPSFSLTSVNPGFVFGPQAFTSAVKDELNTSCELINKVLKLGKDDELPPSKGTFIDVRDVAKAHIISFERETLVNQRLLMTSGRFAAQDVLDILNATFPQLSERLPVGEVGTGPSITSKLARIDNTKTMELLEFPFISLRESVIDTVGQILDAQKSQ